MGEAKRRAETRRLYKEVYGSTRDLRGPERRLYSSSRRHKLRRTVTAVVAQAPVLRKRSDG